MNMRLGEFKSYLPIILMLPMSIGAVIGIIKTNIGKPNERYVMVKDVPNVPQELNEIKYGGSTSMAPLRHDNKDTTNNNEGKLIEIIMKAFPGFRLKYTEPENGETPGSITGMKMLVHHKLTFAMSSDSLNEIIGILRREKINDYNLSPEDIQDKYEEKEVAKDCISFFVSSKLIEKTRIENKQLQTGFTDKDLENIFQRKKKNWHDFGGPKEEITIYSRNPNSSGTVNAIIGKFNNFKPFDTKIDISSRDTTAVVRKLSKVTGGFGYATASEACNQDNIYVLPVDTENNTYVSPCIRSESTGKKTANVSKESYKCSMERPLFIIYRKEAGADREAGLAYANMLITNELQAEIQKLGFKSYYKVK